MPNPYAISVTTKQRRIILAMLNSGSHVTLNEIAEKTGLSLRTVRYNMDMIKGWFKSENIDLVSRPGYGYDIRAGNAERRHLKSILAADKQEISSLNKKQRRLFSIFLLLINDSPISYQELANNGGISKSTIIRDFSEMKKWLERFTLELHQTPNLGTYITGSELSRRYAMIYIIRNMVGEKAYYAMWNDCSLINEESAEYPPAFESFLTNLPLSKCREYISLVETIMGLRLALESRAQLMLYLAITLAFKTNASREKKPKKNSQYTNVKLTNDTAQGYEEEIAVFLIMEITKQTGLQLGSDDIQYFTRILMFSRWEIAEKNYLGITSDSNDRFFPLDDECISCAELIITACSHHLNLLLRSDRDLHQNLARHLQLDLRVMRSGLPIINDNLEMTIRQYPEVYRAVKTDIHLLEEFTGCTFPDDEIANITTYIVASLDNIRIGKNNRIPVTVVGNGTRTYTLFLQNRLQLLFPNLKITRVLNGYPQEGNSFADDELVLSLIPVNKSEKNILEISPFLVQDEIDMIRCWIEAYENDARRDMTSPKSKPGLTTLLSLEHIRFSREAFEDWEDVVRECCHPLSVEGSLEESYCDSIIEITRQYGAYSVISPGVILLHARPDDGVNRLCMSVLFLKEPVRFADSADVDIAFVIGMPNNYSHLNALFQLNEMFKNEGFLSTIRSCKNEQEALRTFWVFSLQTTSSASVM